LREKTLTNCHFSLRDAFEKKIDVIDAHIDFQRIWTSFFFGKQKILIEKKIKTIKKNFNEFF